MNKLIQQILKFGVVGGISFLIDYIVALMTMKLLTFIFGAEFFEVGSVIASVIGFTVSVVLNYILSFKYVFARKEDMDRKAQFVIFVILSLIGAGINSLIMWVCTGPVYSSSEQIQSLGQTLVFTGAKVLATGIVMVYNFITRKIFLEQKEQ